MFFGCTKIVVDMNLFLVTPDAIAVGNEVEPSALLEGARDALAKMGINIDGQMKHFRIETASSGSTIDVLAAKAGLL